MKKIIISTIILALVTACTVSYKFNGANIDYTQIKTLNIEDFQNRALLVYPPLAQEFNETIKDAFVQGTKLNLTNQNADWEIGGDIVRYDLTPQAVQEDAYASQTRLTMTVKYWFKNNKNPAEGKEGEISAYRDFPAGNLLDQVQDDLIKELNKEIVDQIFNAIAANW